MLKLSPTPSAFADITPLLDHLPPAPVAVAEADVSTQLERYHVKAGPLLPLMAHLQRWQKNGTILHHPRVCLFASSYAAPADADTITHNTISMLQADQHPLKNVTATLNADLRIYELDMAQTKRTPQQAAQALTYGMLSIDDKSDTVIVGSLSEGADKAAAKMIFSENLTPDEVLHALVPVMGLDFFAALGAALAARLAGQAIIVAGVFGALLQDVLDRLHAQAADHVIASVTDIVTQDMMPVFSAIQNLQQARFLLSFLPVQHVKII